MTAGNMLNSICPKCGLRGTVVDVKDLAGDFPDFVVDSFCSNPKCYYAERNRRIGSSHKMLNNVFWERGKRMYVDNEVIEIIQNMRCSDNRSSDNFDKAFAGGVLEFAKPSKRKAEVLIPACNAFSYIPSSIRVSESSIRYPKRRTALAGLMSLSYYPELLFVTDSPRTGLKLRVASAAVFSSPAAVLIPIPGRFPPLRPIIYPELVVSFVSDPVVQAYVDREFSGMITHVSPLELQVAPGALAMYLWRLMH